MTLSNYITLKDVARILRLRYHTARRRVLARQLKIERIGRTILIDRKDLGRVKS